MKFIKFQPLIWSDAGIGDLTSNEILAFIWGWTNSQITDCGFCEYSLSRFTFETKLDFQVALSMVQKLPRSVMHFPERRILYFRRFIRHQHGSGESLIKNNVFKTIIAIFDNITHDPLKQAILEDYPEISHAPKKQAANIVTPPAPPKQAVAMVIKEPTPRPPPNRAELLAKAKASEDEVVAYCLTLGLPATDGEWFFSKCEGCGWINNGKPIKDWRATVRAWALAGHLPSKRKPVSKNGERPLYVSEIAAVIKAKETMAEAIRQKHAHEAPTGWEWRDEVKRQEWLAMRKQIKDLNQQLAQSA